MDVVFTFVMRHSVDAQKVDIGKIHQIRQSMMIPVSELTIYVYVSCIMKLDLNEELGSFLQEPSLKGSLPIDMTKLCFIKS